MRVNQMGDEIQEHPIFTAFHASSDIGHIQQTIELLLEHLGLEVWETNATKHGAFELQLRKRDQ